MELPRIIRGSFFSHILERNRERCYNITMGGGRMQIETADSVFMEYGFVYRKMNKETRDSMICQTMHITAQRSLSQFLHFSCEAYLEVQCGTGILLVSYDPENGKIDEFGMNQRVHIKPNVYFALVATTQELVVNVYVEDD